MHFAAAQTRLAHTPLSQFPPMTHALPSGHGSQLPPQSTSVSSPFFAPSAQVAPAQTPSWQELLSQSEPRTHVFPLLQVAQSEPPQSTAVSFPSCLPSRHSEDSQIPLEQIVVMQSVPVAHC
ncbi:MAG TPA: hypothetical protein VHE30_15095 [Polyangiaceae bacterium]|nr:hypothetical protein [Polyangiaceae bacterium]